MFFWSVKSVNGSQKMLMLRKNFVDADSLSEEKEAQADNMAREFLIDSTAYG